MTDLKINHSPIRTSRNYQINHIKMNAIPLATNATFHNCFLQNFDNKAISVSEEIDSPFHLTYGNGIELEKQINNNANVALKLEITDTSSKDNIIHFILDDNNQHLIENIEIIMKENSHASISIRYANSLYSNFNYIQFTNGKLENVSAVHHENKLQNGGYHNGMIHVTLEKNANLSLTVMNLLDTNTTNILAMENQLAENAILEYNIVDFGGNSSVTNYYSNLQGDCSINNLNTIYLGVDNQLFDMNYIATTYGRKTKVNIDVQGALKDYAKKHFKGTIDFKRGGKKAEGSENEFCMLLSNEAKSISLPMLLCEEEDVIGNHASAAGKVNHKELFYLMTRGLTEEEAKTLLVLAKMNPVLGKITNESLKREILLEISKKLGNTQIIMNK